MIIDPTFESLDSKKQRKLIEWAPVYFLPKTTGEEKFVVAVIGRSQSEITVKIANNLESMQCIYGHGSKFLVELIYETLKVHSSKLEKDPEIFAPNMNFPYENICIGAIKETSAISLNSVVESWLRELSSFHQSEHSVLTEKRDQRKSEFLEFRKNLLDKVTQQNIHLAKYFDEGRFRSNRYKNASKVDYLSDRNAFNLAWFSPNEIRKRIQQGESSLARLAALKNISLEDYGGRNYQLIIAGAPENINAHIDGQMFKNMMEELNYSSEPLGIGLNSVSSSSELINKVLELEL